LKLRLFGSLLCVILLASSAGAQSTNPSSTKSPEVFLDNHRPLIKKKDKAPTSRDVSGKVVDENGNPLEGALVTLKDTKTNARTTFITKKDGRYNFDDLSFDIDYELGARYKDLATETRKLSQYDRNPNIVRILQIQPRSDSSASTTDGAKKPTLESKR
jgi:Carboxypeptidase regulatory-like domain